LGEERVFVLAGRIARIGTGDLLVNDTALPLPNQHIAMATWGPRMTAARARAGEISRSHEHCREFDRAGWGVMYAAATGGVLARRYAEAMKGAGEPLSVASGESAHDVLLYMHSCLAAGRARPKERTQVMTEP
jgi:hypothetical protein